MDYDNSSGTNDRGQNGDTAEEGMIKNRTDQSEQKKKERHSSFCRAQGGGALEMMHPQQCVRRPPPSDQGGRFNVADAKDHN